MPYSPCGRAYASELVEKLTTPPSVCVNRSFAECQQALDRILTAAHDKPTAACEPATLDLVDKAFRAYVKASVTTSAEQQLTFKNRPPTRFAFGAGAGVMLTAKLTEPRVALKDGILRADPLDRVLTTAYVNVSPRGYNPEAATMSIHERIRPMFGAALTPDFGLVFGANVLIVRGIGVSGGVAVLFAKGARQGEIGSAPEDSTDPFRLSIATAPFLGISYNYK